MKRTQHHVEKPVNQSFRFSSTLKCSSLLRALEEIADRDIENLAEQVKPAGADAVCAALILLDLLKGQVQRRGEMLLGYAEQCAALAQTASDLYVDWVGSCHHKVVSIRLYNYSILCDKQPQTVDEIDA